MLGWHLIRRLTPPLKRDVPENRPLEHCSLASPCQWVALADICIDIYIPKYVDALKIKKKCDAQYLGRYILIKWSCTQHVHVFLEETSLPSANSGIQLAEFVDVVCALLDIPVYK
jgi:hypothetical protein